MEPQETITVLDKNYLNPGILKMVLDDCVWYKLTAEQFFFFSLSHC